LDLIDRDGSLRGLALNKFLVKKITIKDLLKIKLEWLAFLNWGME
jgi:hypothetical protein